MSALLLLFGRFARHTGLYTFDFDLGLGAALLVVELPAQYPKPQTGKDVYDQGPFQTPSVQVGCVLLAT